MFDFVRANNEIDKKSLLAEQTDQLTKLVIDRKKVFTKKEVKLDLGLIQDNGVIEMSEETIRLGENGLLSYLDYLTFAQRFNFELIEDIETLFVFLERIRVHFDSGKNSGITRFLRGWMPLYFSLHI